MSGTQSLPLTLVVRNTFLDVDEGCSEPAPGRQRAVTDGCPVSHTCSTRSGVASFLLDCSWTLSAFGSADGDQKEQQKPKKPKMSRRTKQRQNQAFEKLKQEGREHCWRGRTQPGIQSIPEATPDLAASGQTPPQASGSGAEAAASRPRVCGQCGVVNEAMGNADADGAQPRAKKTKESGRTRQRRANAIRNAMQRELGAE